MNLLNVQHLTAFYGSAQALFDVSLRVDEGKVTALMGRNGMGKTTTIRAICRMISSAGTLNFAGEDLHLLPSHSVARLGVGLVPEGRRCFRDLTVEENLIAAARNGDWTKETVGELFPRLMERLPQRAASLSGGEQQMLAIGRALMTNPRLLILDEATEGLAPIIRQEIWSALTRIKSETGTAILIVDKSLTELTSISDTAVIVERGVTVWQGAVDALSPEVTETFLGL